MVCRLTEREQGRGKGGNSFKQATVAEAKLAPVARSGIKSGRKKDLQKLLIVNILYLS